MDIHSISHNTRAQKLFAYICNEAEKNVGERTYRSSYE